MAFPLPAILCTGIPRTVNKEKYLSALTSANYKTAVWMLVAGILLVTNLLQTLFLFTADLTEKTIVVPPDLAKPFSIHKSEVSPAYVEQMPHYLSQLLLTYHDDNVAAQFDSVLRHVDPSAYAHLKAEFHAQADRVRRHLIGSVFYPMGIHVAKLTATINGELVSMIGQKIVSRKQKYYQFAYAYRNGSFYLVKFQELEKGSGEALKPIEPKEDEEVTF